MSGKRYATFYFNQGQPEKIRQVAPEHVQYWHSAGLPDYLGGPFSDRSGGLIIFSASSLEEAQAIILGDPFVREGLMGQQWLKEWLA